MGAGRGLRMILHAENRQLAMTHPFDGAVVQVDMRHFHFVRQRLGIDRETMILRRDRDLAGLEVFDRLVSAAMTKLQFEGAPAKSVAEHLMAETDAEDR